MRVLCVGGQVILTGTLCVCALPVCVCAASPCLTFRRILLVCGRSMELTDSVQVRWKERLLVEIPLFATRLLCWSTLLRVIVPNVASIDWTDRKRQPERENILLSQTVFFWVFYLAPLSWLSAWNRWILLTKRVCMARHFVYVSVAFCCCWRRNSASCIHSSKGLFKDYVSASLGDCCSECRGALSSSSSNDHFWSTDRQKTQEYKKYINRNFHEKLDSQWNFFLFPYLLVSVWLFSPPMLSPCWLNCSGFGVRWQKMLNPEAWIRLNIVQTNIVRVIRAIYHTLQGAGVVLNVSEMCGCWSHQTPFTEAVILSS